RSLASLGTGRTSALGLEVGWPSLSACRLRSAPYRAARSGPKRIAPNSGPIACRRSRGRRTEPNLSLPLRADGAAERSGRATRLVDLLHAPHAVSAGRKDDAVLAQPLCNQHCQSAAAALDVQPKQTAALPCSRQVRPLVARNEPRPGDACMARFER